MFQKSFILVEDFKFEPSLVEYELIFLIVLSLLHA